LPTQSLTVQIPFSALCEKQTIADCWLLTEQYEHVLTCSATVETALTHRSGEDGVAYLRRSEAAMEWASLASWEALPAASWANARRCSSPCAHKHHSHHQYPECRVALPVHVLQAHSWTWLVRIHAALMCIVQQPEDVLLEKSNQDCQDLFCRSVAETCSGPVHSINTVATTGQLHATSGLLSVHMLCIVSWNFTHSRTHTETLQLPTACCFWSRAQQPSSVAVYQDEQVVVTVGHRAGNN